MGFLTKQKVASYNDVNAALVRISGTPRLEIRISNNVQTLFTGVTPTEFILQGNMFTSQGWDSWVQFDLIHQGVVINGTSIHASEFFSSDGGYKSTIVNINYSLELPEITILPTITSPIISQSELYEVTLKTNINPLLPNWIIERLRSVLNFAGYGLNNIYPVDNGYKMELEKFGTFPILAVWGAIKIVLFLVGIIISLIQIKKVTETTSSTYQVSNTIDDALDYAKRAGYTPEETNDLIKSIQGAYPEIQPSGTGSIFGGINTTLGLGLMTLLIIMAMRK